MLALSTRRSLLVGRGLLGASQSQRRLSGEPVSGNGVIGLRRYAPASLRETCKNPPRRSDALCVACSEEKGRWERRAGKAASLACAGAAVAALAVV